MSTSRREREIREMTAAVRQLTSMVEEIGRTAQAMHLTLLDSGLVEPRQPLSWEVEREVFMRGLDGAP